jgi:TrmH family RNA methyltransferase
MLSKNQIKFINSLKIKKFRDEHKLFVAEGTKIVPELVNSSIIVKEVFTISENNTFPTTIKTTLIKPAELERISSLTTPNQLLAICEIPNYNIENNYSDKLTLALDDIKDPGNLGTIIRIADWFGIDTIICSKNTADAYNPKVVQATMGSIARVKIVYTNLTDFLTKESKHNTSIYGALLEGDNVYQQEKTNGIILIGSESHGISEENQKLIHHKIKIPSFSHLKTGDGAAESLNAAIATAIICSEFRRN